MISVVAVTAQGVCRRELEAEETGDSEQLLLSLFCVDRSIARIAIQVVRGKDDKPLVEAVSCRAQAL